MNIVENANQSLRHVLLAKAKGQQSRAVLLVGILINHVQTVKELENFAQSMAMSGVNLPSAVKMVRLGGKICTNKKIIKKEDT